MSRQIDLTKIENSILRNMNSDLILEIPPSKYMKNAQPKYICLFDRDKNTAFIPFAYAKDYKRPERKSFRQISPTFTSELRESQKEVCLQAINMLNNNGSVILSLYTGFGKTCSAIFLSTKIRLPTLIICHRIVLLNQWAESIKKFTNATFQIVETNDELKEVDFYIMNAMNIPKNNRSFYKDIGLVIVDECHLILAESISKCMSYIIPRYVIGLSATAYRVDALHKLFDMYFGANRIEKKLFRKHTVYRINTNLIPEMKTNKSGQIDWSSILEFQAESKERNEMIIDIVKKHRTRTILILLKRISQATYLIDRLNEEKENVTSLIKSEQSFDKSARILVGTIGKCSVGFDHDKLDTLILATDLEQYFIQALGRIFRNQEGIGNEPVVFDLVDDNPLLLKHFKSREKVYKDHGGTILNYNY